MNLAEWSIYLSSLVILVFSSNPTTDTTESVKTISDASTKELSDSWSQSEWMLMFYADWCGACQATKPYFYEFATWARQNRPDLNVAIINYADSSILMAQFGITHLPTIFYIKDGSIRNVSDKRDKLDQLLQTESWKQIKPHTSFLAPFSIYGRSIAMVARFGLFSASILTKLTFLSRSQLVIVFALMVTTVVLFFLILTAIENWAIKRNKTKKKQSTKTD